MTGATLNGRSSRERTSSWDDVLPYLLGGWVLGVTSIAICLCLDALVLGTIQWLWVGTENQFWPQGAVIAAAVGSVIMSLAVGYWMFHLRRWIGRKGDPADFEIAHRKRWHFTVGSMCGYWMITPVVWFLILALATSTAQAPTLSP